jgi:molybdopterin-guanine dinucleotide biosynthesis protein A
MLTISIQAGGRSLRMGRDKGLVHLAGRPLIEHILERIDGLGDEVLVITNRPQAYAYLGVLMKGDTIPGIGALMGLRTALGAARGTHVLVLACDMPFVNRPLLEYMIGLAPQVDVIVPQIDGNYEPMHAIYGRHCLPAVEASLHEGDTRLISFYDKVRVRTVVEKEIKHFDPRLMSFFNVNTPEDLARAEKIFQQQTKQNGI